MKAIFRKRWVPAFIQDTGADDETANVAFEVWWRSSFMAWMANLTGVALLAAAVIGSTYLQTLTLINYQHGRESLMYRRALVITHNHSVIVYNQMQLCAHAHVACHDNWQTAPER